MATSSWFPQIWGDQRPGEEPFQALRRHFDDLMEDMTRSFGAPLGPTRRQMMSPHLDLCETDNEMILTAELPGVDQKDVDVNLTGRQLTLKGEKRCIDMKKEGKDASYHRAERCFGSFRRTVAMPFEADPSSVSATFRDGILTVIVPKPAEMKSKTVKIEIKPPS
jgi:HSP20 family protein